MIAAAAGILGTYFLYGTGAGAKKRAKIKGWMLKVKGDVLSEVEKLKDVSEGQYDKIVARVLSKYNKLKDVDSQELKLVGNDLKRAWKTFERDVKKAVKNKKKST